MKLAYAFFCEYARKGQNGTTDILGIFSGIRAQVLPTRSESLYLCAQIDMPEAELGSRNEFKFGFALRAPSGEVVASMVDDTAITRYHEDSVPNLQIVLNLTDAVFVEKGYHSSLLMAGNEGFDGPSIFIDYQGDEA